jgi:hypothetical protein
VSLRTRVFLTAALVALATAPAATAQEYPNDPPSGGGAPTVSIQPARSTVEGNAGVTQLAFTVMVAPAASAPITLTYETQNGSAAPPADFVPIPPGTTMVIPAGATSASIAVEVVGDLMPEQNELFYVHLAGASGGGASVSATGHHGNATIMDDDGGAGAADTRPPNTVIHGGPGRVTRSRTASFHLASTEPGSRFQCRLDRGRWRACRASVTLRRLARGRHTFRARAIDRAGNVDRTPAAKTWRIR